jgi:hypothetical protein
MMNEQAREEKQAMFAPMNPMTERIRIQNEQPQREHRAVAETLRKLFGGYRPEQTATGLRSDGRA